MKTVYVSIGNSDDKLTQADWATFYEAADAAIRRVAHQGPRSRRRPGCNLGAACIF